MPVLSAGHPAHLPPELPASAHPHQALGSGGIPVRPDPTSPTGRSVRAWCVPVVFQSVKKLELAQSRPQRLPAAEPLEVALSNAAGPRHHWHDALRVVLVPQLLRGLWRQGTASAAIATQVASTMLAAQGHRPLVDPSSVSTVEDLRLLRRLSALEVGLMTAPQALGSLLERLRREEAASGLEPCALDVDEMDSPAAPATGTAAHPSALPHGTPDHGHLPDTRPSHSAPPLSFIQQLMLQEDSARPRNPSVVDVDEMDAPSAPATGSAESTATHPSALPRGSPDPGHLPDTRPSHSAPPPSLIQQLMREHQRNPSVPPGPPAPSHQPRPPASRVRPRASSAASPPVAVRRRTVDWGPLVEHRALSSTAVADSAPRIASCRAASWSAGTATSCPSSPSPCTQPRASSSAAVDTQRSSSWCCGTLLAATARRSPAATNQ